MWKGFRQNQPTPDDAPLCIITFVHPVSKRRVYHRLLGLPFGLGAVVNQFNRFPALWTCFNRRIMCFMSAHYFDDNTTLELRCLAPWTKRQFGRCAAFFNVFLNSKKSMRISSMQHFLGCLNDFTPLRNDLAIVFGCKYATRQKCLKLINEHLASGVMGSAAASKLRGVTQWVDRNLMGRPCRGALCALTARQLCLHRFIAPPCSSIFLFFENRGPAPAMISMVLQTGG